MLERHYKKLTVGLLALTFISCILGEQNDRDFVSQTDKKSSDNYVLTDSLDDNLEDSMHGGLAAESLYNVGYDQGQDKRSFKKFSQRSGFGRRLDPLMFGGRLGKRSYDNDFKEMDDEKRRLPDKYTFASMLGKRALDRYAFLGNLGKRAIDRYSFASALGKRSDEESDSEFDTDKYLDDRDRRFDYNMFAGRLGRRGMDRNLYFGQLGKRLPDAHAFLGQLGKRGRTDSHMFFGNLGKRGRPDSHMFFGNLGRRAPDPRMFIGQLGKRGRMDSKMFFGQLGKRSMSTELDREDSVNS